MTVARASSFVLCAMLTSACSQAPHYIRPAVEVPAVFKEAQGWRPASPADAVAKGAWWTVFGDPVLDGLEARVLVSNQNLAAAAAAYAQARASVRETRASRLPEVSLSGSGTRTGSFGDNGGAAAIGSTTAGSAPTGLPAGAGDRRYTLSLGATWEPDLWGRLGAAVDQSRAQAEASEADLVNATLSVQGELAASYLHLRAIDAQQMLLNDVSAVYGRSLEITANRYREGIAGKVDILQAETQLRNARAQAADLVRQRAQLEHAVAVLVGQNPSTFTLPAVPWKPRVPDSPSVVPATLVERRPDVAAAERRVAAANAAIGIRKAAFFPSIDLSGAVGGDSSGLGALFDAAGSFWSLGLGGALTLLDFGARSARVAEARAAYEQNVANYRQTVLGAFQQTEDALVAVRVLADVHGERSAAQLSATGAERLIFNQYLAGRISYVDVVAVQTAALSARQAEVVATLDRQLAIVSLIQAIGGSWDRAAAGTGGVTGPPYKLLQSQADRSYPGPCMLIEDHPACGMRSPQQDGV